MGSSGAARPGLIRNDLDAVNTFYGLPQVGASASAVMPTLNRAYAIPISVARSAPLLSVGMETVASAGSATWHSALFGSTAGLPGSLVTDYSTLVMTTLAINSWTPGTPDVLVAGLRYSIVVWLTALTGTPTYRQRNTCDPQVTFGTSAPSTLSGSLTAHFTDTGFTGAAPGSFGAVAGQVQGPALLVKLG